MLRARVIPVLLMSNGALVKTTRFNNHIYVGDPCNTVRIFNELEVDELIFLDIDVSKKKKKPDYELLSEIADECFMPLTYGGGVKTLEDVEKILGLGFEKIAFNASILENPNLITEAAKLFGSQAIVASIDVKKKFLTGKKLVYSHVKGRCVDYDPELFACELERLGAGEILLTSVDNEGSWNGYDQEITKSVSTKVEIPVIAHGGAGSLRHIEEVFLGSGATAVGLGSMVVFQRKGMGVLVNFPSINDLEKIVPTYH